MESAKKRRRRRLREDMVVVVGLKVGVESFIGGRQSTLTFDGRKMVLELVGSGTSIYFFLFFFSSFCFSGRTGYLQLINRKEKRERERNKRKVFNY